MARSKYRCQDLFMLRSFFSSNLSTTRVYKTESEQMLSCLRYIELILLDRANFDF